MSRLPPGTVGRLSSTLNLGVEGGDRPPVILRDAQVLPALRAILEGGLLRYLDRARQVLTEPLGARGRRRPRRHRPPHLARPRPLGDAEAAELAAGLIELAADT